MKKRIFAFLCLLLMISLKGVSATVAPISPTPPVLSVLPAQASCCTPPAPAVSARVFCSNNNPTVANLFTFATNASYYYISHLKDGESSWVDVTTTTALSTGWYYAFQIVDGCMSEAIQANVIILPSPTPPVVNSVQQFCSGTNPTVAKLAAIGENIKWYTTASGGLPLPDNDALTTRTYYVSESVGGCAESARKAVTVTTGVSCSRTVWKVLWAIFPKIDATFNCVDYQSAMTEEEIELVKIKAGWFKQFIESYTNNKVELQITTEVIHNPVTTLHHWENNTFWGFDMPMADQLRLKPLDNFDTQIYTADYTEIPKPEPGGWLGLADGGKRTNWIAFCHSSTWDLMQYGGLNPSYEMKQLHTGVYVHEWLHLLESHFSSLFEPMPIVDGGLAAYGYTAANTGIFDGETLLGKFYVDYLGGNIVKYPGATATSTCKGVHPDWWQYPPLYFKNWIITSPENLATNVPVSPIVTVKWQNPVVSTWIAGQFHVILEDGVTGDELGFYEVTNLMSADKKTLTINFSQLLYKMWDNKYVTVNFERGKTYRLRSYELVYSGTSSMPRPNANFSILFTIQP